MTRIHAARTFLSRIFVMSDSVRFIIFLASRLVIDTSYLNSNMPIIFSTLLSISNEKATEMLLLANFKLLIWRWAAPKSHAISTTCWNIDMSHDLMPRHCICMMCTSYINLEQLHPLLIILSICTLFDTSVKHFIENYFFLLHQYTVICGIHRKSSWIFHLFWRSMCCLEV